MDTMLFEIVEKLDSLAWASEADFRLGPGQVVSPEIVLTQPIWSLYSINLSSGSAWFVELPADLDLSTSAFAFLDQYKHARRVLQVPLNSLRALADRVPAPEGIIFVFNIGRCGSTLISHVLNTCPQVWSLSEPIAFPQLIMRNYNSDHRQDFPRDKLVGLIRACTRLLFRPPAAAKADIFAVKFHSQCLFQADIYHEAFPEASFVFLYREAVGWTRSFYQMARKYGFPAVLTGPEKTSIWNTVTAADDTSHLSPFVELDAASVALEDGLVIGWARCMEEYSRMFRDGVPFLAVRYDQLNKDRETSLEHLFRHCDLPTTAVHPALSAFERDSQAGTLVSHEVEGDAMSAAQVQKLRGVLGRYPGFGDPDLRLPDIYSGTTQSRLR